MKIERFFMQVKNNLTWIKYSILEMERILILLPTETRLHYSFSNINTVIYMFMKLDCYKEIISLDTQLTLLLIFSPKKGKHSAMKL